MPLTVLDAVTRHQIFLEGLKAGELDRFQTTLAAVNRDVRERLQGVPFETMDGLTKQALAVLLADLKKIVFAHYNKYVVELVFFLQRFMDVDRTMTIDVLEQFAEPEALPRPPEAAPSGRKRLTVKKDDSYPILAVLWGRAKNAPIPANGLLMMDFITALAGVATLSILNKVRQAFANRDPVTDLITSISGTRPAMYRDGLLSRTSNNARAVIGTTLQHIRAINAEAVGSMLYDEYEWCSVIDNATTDICLSRDGNRYRYGKGPIPPAHVGCRSTTVPVINGVAGLSETFQKWAERQGFALNRSMFGRDRPGTHFDGSPPLTLDEYAAKKGDILADG